MNSRRPRNSVPRLASSPFAHRCAPWLPGLLVLAGAAVYANSVSVPFIFDDGRGIVRNEQIQSLSTAWEALGKTNRPVTTLSFAINYAIGELNVTGYHVVNVVIHILTAMTLFGIVRRTLLTDPLRDRYQQAAPWLALAVALIWVVHPLATQAVTYISQRSEAMMALCYCLTLYAVIHCAQGRARYGWGVAAVVVCALGMGAKEVMVTAPFLVLLYDRTFLAGSLARALKQRWGLYLGMAATWLILAGAIGMAISAETGAAAGFGMHPGSSVRYALTQPAVLMHYLRLAAWPEPLCLDYAWPIARSAVDIVPYAIAIAALLIATAWALWRRWASGFIAASFFAILAPTSSIMPIDDLAFEHRMYLPLAAVIALAVMSGDRLLTGLRQRQHLLGGAVLLVIVIALGFVTIHRNRDYQTKVALWRSVVDVSPHNNRAHYNLGTALQLDEQFDEAISQFQRVLQARPDHAQAHASLGVVSQKRNNLDEAIGHYRDALAIDPLIPEARNNLVLALQELAVAAQTQGDLDQAMTLNREALDIDPEYAEGHNNIGIIFHLQRNLDKAISHYHQALQIRPDFAKAHYNLAMTLQLQGRMDEALTSLRQAMRARPDWPLPIRAVAWILATHPNADVRDPSQALRLAERAAQLTQHRDVSILDTLAAAYAATGQFDQAVSTARAALELATGARAGQVRQRLQLYLQGKPYRLALPVQRQNLP